MTAWICDRKAGLDFDVSGLLADKGDACVVDRARAIFDQARSESCGKSVFCREGAIQLFQILTDGTTGKGQPDDLELLSELAVMVRDNAGCQMASAAAAALASLLEKYPEEFDQHWKRGRCPALQCKAYYSLHILPDRCTGCGACVPSCPEKAIAGGPGLVHVIDQQACTRCGACIDVCRPIAQAIAKAGAVKPRTPESPVPVGSWDAEAGGRRRRRRGGGPEAGGEE